MNLIFLRSDRGINKKGRKTASMRVAKKMNNPNKMNNKYVFFAAMLAK